MKTLPFFLLAIIPVLMGQLPPSTPTGFTVTLTNAPAIVDDSLIPLYHHRKNTASSSVNSTWPHTNGIWFAKAEHRVSFIVLSGVGPASTHQGNEASVYLNQYIPGHLPGTTQGRDTNQLAGECGAAEEDCDKAGTR